MEVGDIFVMSKDYYNSWNFLIQEDYDAEFIAIKFSQNKTSVYYEKYIKGKTYDYEKNILPMLEKGQGLQCMWIEGNTVIVETRIKRERNDKLNELV